MEAIKHDNWKGTTGGQPWMLRMLIILFRFVNIRIPYYVMGFVILFYMIFNHKEYVAMYRFFRQRMAFNAIKAFGYVYLNHYRFGQIILDRFAAYAGKKFKIEIDHYDRFQTLASKEGGFVQISSHVGNYELAGYSLVAKEKHFNALIFSGEKETVMSNRNKMLSPNNMSMVPVKEDLSHVFVLNNALANGEIVSMPGDRIFGSPKYAECLFFGENARFPLGPFAMAIQREVPLLAVFVMKESVNRYQIFIRNVVIEPSKEATLTRKEKMNELAQCFAMNLEDIVRKYPAQWFNYYDFWKK